MSINSKVTRIHDVDHPSASSCCFFSNCNDVSICIWAINRLVMHTQAVECGGQAMFLTFVCSGNGHVLAMANGLKHMGSQLLK
jgi:hypothetical protein